MQRYTLFISDLHLEETNDEITSIFIGLIDKSQCDPMLDAIYILGDLFETWIGDDNSSPFCQKIIRTLQHATQQGLAIYFLHGNRDFLIGERFAKDSGCQLLPEEYQLNLYGTSVLLMHGDTLCTKDTAYLKTRKWCRHRGLQFLFLHLPIRWRQWVANRMRQASKTYTEQTSLEKMDVEQSTVEHIMQKHNTLCLIHGHTHQCAIHHFTLPQGPATRIVLNAWHQRGNKLIWFADGQKKLVDFK